MNNYLLSTSIAMLIAGCSGEYTDIQDAVISKSSAGDGPFYECFDANYHDSTVIPAEAYQRGECFMSLALENTANKDSAFNEFEVGASKNTILQYANSWFSLAAENGYPLASDRLSANNSALYALEESVQVKQPKSQLLASEKAFDALDINNDGALSLQEASYDQELVKLFLFSDFDDDGTISLPEYIIYSGEATAAGNPDSNQNQME